MKRRTRSMIASALLGLAVTVSAVILPAGPATAAFSGPPPPTDLRVTDLRIDSITVAWNPVDGASGYSVSPFGSYSARVGWGAGACAGLGGFGVSA